MDYLDTLDFPLSKKRSQRVRSWYLYEQFKSLEQNQVEAAGRLKERSYQDKILRQELNDRRARRKLYDQIGVTESQTSNDNNNKNDEDKSLCTSSDDMFREYARIQDNEYVIRETEVSSDPSQPDSLIDEYEDYKTVDDHTIIATGTTNSATNVNSEETMIEDFGTSRTANLNTVDLHYDEVKEQLENLEKLTELCDDVDRMSVSIGSEDFKHISKKDISVYTHDNGILTMWGKLVTFAYQVIELNYGNCYYDYGSQLLTAVLACDVLRRGINKMCDILQPYVSPIKFASNTYTFTNDCYHKSVRRKTSQPKYKKHKLKIHCKRKPRLKNNFARRHCSENWQNCVNYTMDSRRSKIKCRTSEPWRRDQKVPFYFDYTSTKSSSSIWPGFSNGSSEKQCNCGCGSRVITPMIKLSQYIDSILHDIEQKHS